MLLRGLRGRRPALSWNTGAACPLPRPRPVCSSASPAAPRHRGHPADTQASCAGDGAAVPGAHLPQDAGQSGSRVAPRDLMWVGLSRDIPSPPTALKHRHFSDAGTDTQHLQGHVRGAAGPSLRSGGAESRPGTRGAPGGLLETPPPPHAASSGPSASSRAEVHPRPPH